MKHCLLFLFILSWAAGLCPANPAAPQRPPNRFLFILETSSEMKRLAPAAEKSVLDLVRSGMGGLMENGDTFGFWSFNDEFHSGQIPMQIWNAEQSEELTYTARAYLKNLRYEKKPHFEKILPHLLSVTRSSRVITVILISSGTKPIMGTPFDQPINEYFRANQRQFHKDKIPFLTILLAQNGNITRHSANPAIGDIRLPKPPQQPAIAETKPQPEKTPQPATPSPSPSPAPEPLPPALPAPTTSQALVIKGKKAQRVSVEEADALLDSQPAAPLVEKIQETPPKPAEKVSAPASPVTEVQPQAPAPEIASVPEPTAPKPEPAPPTVELPAEPTVPTAAPETQPASPEPIVASSPAEPVSTEPLHLATSSQNGSTNPLDPEKPETLQKPEAIPSPNAAPEKETPPSPAAVVASTQPAAAPEAPEPFAKPIAPAESTEPAASPTAAVATVPANESRARLYLIAGAGMLLVGIALGFVVAWRLRRPSQQSLITRSVEKSKH